MSISFVDIRTRRLSVKLRELSLGDCIDLVSRPVELFEAETTALLRAIAEKAETPTLKHVSDPRLMTVQERMVLVAHYLSSTSSDSADFSIGKHRLSDYFMPAKDLGTWPVLLSAEQTDIEVYPLVGWMVELIETFATTRAEWNLAAMACQLVRRGETRPNPLGAAFVDLRAWLDERIAELKAMPESEFLIRYGAWMDATTQLEHFFAIEFADDGIVAVPIRKEGEAVGDVVATARFPARTCINELTKVLFGRSEVTSG